MVVIPLTWNIHYSLVLVIMLLRIDYFQNIQVDNGMGSLLNVIQDSNTMPIYRYRSSIMNKYACCVLAHLAHVSYHEDRVR